MEDNNVLAASILAWAGLPSGDAFRMTLPKRKLYGDLILLFFKLLALNL